MNGNGILAAIKGKAHYAISMRPRSPKNLPLDELEAAVRDCVVKRRIFPYPYVPRGEIQRQGDCIEASHEGAVHMDAWSLCRTGRFKEHLGLYEARWPPDETRNVVTTAPLRKKFLEPFVTMYQVSEVFLFASRLAIKIPDVWRIEIELHDMQDRMLDIRVPKPFGLRGEYRCDVPAISLSAELDSWSLQLRYDDLAVEKTLEIVERFGWSDKSLERTFKREQERMYRQGQTRAMPPQIRLERPGR